MRTQETTSFEFSTQEVQAILLKHLVNNGDIQIESTDTSQIFFNSASICLNITKKRKKPFKLC